MIILDASVLIAHFTPGDAHGSSALEILDTEEELALHFLTLAEILVHPAKVGAERTIHKALDTLGVMQLPVTPDEPSRIARIRATTSLRMPDACVLAAALHHGASLATFDAHLARVAKDNGVTTWGVAA